MNYSIGNTIQYRQYHYCTNLTVMLPYMYVCTVPEWCEPLRIQVHMTDVNHTLNHRQKVHYSPLPCDAGLLRAAPPAPSSSQGDHLLLTPGQLCSQAVNMTWTHVQSVHVFMSHKYTFHSTSVSVDQTPQWFLLHCSIGIFRPRHFRCCRCTLTLFSSSSEHPKSLWSIRTTSAWPLWAARNRTVLPHCMCKEQEKYCTAIMSVNCVWVWGVGVFAMNITGAEGGKTGLLDPCIIHCTWI